MRMGPGEGSMRDTEAASEMTPRMRVRARSVLWGLIVGGLIGATAAIALAPPKGARFEARQPWVVAAPSAQDWPRAPRAGERVRLERGPDGATLVVTAGDARSEERRVGKECRGGWPREP